MSDAAAAIVRAALCGNPVRFGSDPAPGKTAFGKDGACNPAKAGGNQICPSLAGIVSRPPRGIEGLDHTEAMEAHDMTWADARPNGYLRDPHVIVAQTTMTLLGRKDGDERANLIACVAALKQPPACPAT